MFIIDLVLIIVVMLIGIALGLAGLAYADMINQAFKD